MAERCVKGDYIGFTLGGVHSSELGLMRVSNGSRYEQDLLPPLQDKTAQVNGRDGAIYFGSQYNTKPIKVPVAFDNMTEESFNRLKRLLQDKKPKYLWFDETPYKQWLVKAANVQNFKWVCFDETKNGGEKRIYKGEGTLEFSCFTPYAESRVTFLDDPVDSVWVWNRENDSNRLVEKKNGEMAKKIITKTEINENWDITTTTTTTFPYIKSPIKLQENETELYLTDDFINQQALQGFFTCIKSGFGNKVETFKIGYPDDIIGEPDDEINDTEVVTKARYIYYIEDENYIPINKQSVNLLATRIGYGEEKTVISVTETGQFGEENYFVVDDADTTQQRNSIILFKDYQGNFFWVDPSDGYPNDTIPVFLLYRLEKPSLESNYNLKEWEKTSKIKNSQYLKQKWYEYQDTSAYIYNAGDVPTNTFISFTSQLKEKTTLSLYSSFDLTNEVAKIILKPFELKGDDVGFIIDSKLKMIKGFKMSEDGKSRIITNNIYNKNHIGGDYFKIPVCADDEYYIIKSTSKNEFTVDYKHYYI